MTATIQWRKQNYEVETPVSVKDALEQLELASELFIVLRNGEPIDESEILQDGEVAKLIPVMVGG